MDIYCWISPDVMAAMLDDTSQKNFDYFFVLDSNMAATSIVFCVSWDRVKPKICYRLEKSLTTIFFKIDRCQMWVEPTVFIVWFIV